MFILSACDAGINAPDGPDNADKTTTMVEEYTTATVGETTTTVYTWYKQHNG